MIEVDIFLVEGIRPIEQNGKLSARIGGKSYLIKKIQKEKREYKEKGEEKEVWVVYGEY